MPVGHGDLSKADLLSETELEQSVVITDPSLPDNPMIFVSDEFEKQTGYPPEEAVGRNCRFLQGPDTDPSAIEKIRQVLKEKGEISIDILNYRRDGTEFWNRLRIRPLYGDDGDIMFFVGAQNPIDQSDVRTEYVGSTQDSRLGSENK